MCGAGISVLVIFVPGLALGSVSIREQ
jgi:hypothetical protein